MVLLVGIDRGLQVRLLLLVGFLLWLQRFQLAGRAGRGEVPVGAVLADAEGSLEDGCIGLLFHEQRNVLEGVVIVHAEAGTHDVVAMAVQIVSDTDAWAEALAVVGCFLPHQRRRQRQHAGDDLAQFSLTELRGPGEGLGVRGALRAERHEVADGDQREEEDRQGDDDFQERQPGAFPGGTSSPQHGTPPEDGSRVNERGA